MALFMADLEAELEALRRETMKSKSGASRAEARGWCVTRGGVQLVRYRGLPRGYTGTRRDPDRPLLRCLNRASGEPVLVMCGQPGDHDPAHAAAGRLKKDKVLLADTVGPGSFAVDADKGASAACCLLSCRPGLTIHKSLNLSFGSGFGACARYP
jgi:hypothetical protein